MGLTKKHSHTSGVEIIFPVLVINFMTRGLSTTVLALAPYHFKEANSIPMLYL